jgi:hypothetical protein
LLKYESSSLGRHSKKRQSPFFSGDGVAQTKTNNKTKHQSISIDKIMNKIGQILENYSPEFLSNPSFHDFLSIVKGARNGAVYGAKIRFPHALVMTLLFRSQKSFAEKARLVSTATFHHSRNLCFFVTIYKTTLILLKRLSGMRAFSR